MADDLNTEIKIGADASGVEAGVGRAKRSLKDLGESAKKAGQDAGAGIGAIGAGGDKAAKDVERATKNIQGQLQRAIASFDAGEKGSRKFYESLARQRGADVNTLKPLLDQLDAYKSKSEAAAQASAKVGTSFTGLSTAAGLAARAVAAIGITASVGEFVRMADASTNVASRLGLVTSSAAELASVQQRLFSIAQSSRVSFTDLVGTYAQVARSTKDLGVSQTALLGVIQTISQAVTISGGSAASAQAALVQLSQGFAAGALRGEELNSIMEQTPRLAQAIADGMGVSVGKLRELGQAGALTAEAVLGALEKSAAGVAAEFGKMAVTVEQASTNAANSVQRLVGAFDRLLGVTSAIGGAIQTISNGLDFLSADVEKLGNQGPLRAAAREVINLNAAAERLRTGMASGVLGPNAQGELDRINARLAEAKQRFRELDQQLSGGKDPRDQSGFTGRGVSYANEAARQAKLREDANAFRLNQAGVPASYLKDMAELIRLNQAGVIVGKEYTDALKAQQDLLLKKTTTVRGSAAAATQEQNAYESLISSIRAKIEADNLEIAGGAALTESQRIRIKLDQDLAAGRVKLTAQNERAVRLALEELSASEAAAEAQKALAKAQADATADRMKVVQSMEASAASVQTQNDALREEIELIGLSAAQQTLVLQQRNEVIILTKEATLAELERQSAVTGTQTRVEIALAAEIAALKERNALLGAKGVKNAAVDAAKTAADEWQKTTDSINQSLTDSLLRGFESGKGFAKNFVDTMKNLFSTLVLRPIISAVVNPVAGAITGALGLAGTASAATSSGSSGASTALSAASLFGAGGIGGSLAAGAGWLTGATTLGGSLTAGASLIGTGTLAGLTSGLGVLAGALGPIALGVGALMAIAKATKGETRTGGQFGVSFDGTVTNQRRGETYTYQGQQFDRDFSNGQRNALIAGQAYRLEGDPVQNEQAIRDAVSGTASGINAFLKALGSKATLTGFSAGLETSSKGRGGVFAGGILSDGTTFGESGKGDNYAGTLYEKFSTNSPDFKTALENFTLDLKQSTIQALQSVTDIPETVKKMLKGVDAEGLSEEAANKLLESINAQIVGVQNLTSAFDQMGMDSLAGIAFDVAAGLAEVSGGFDKLLANLNTYYSNFFSPEEQRANMQRQLQEQFAKLNLTLPDINASDARAQYRRLVEAAEKDMSEEGRKTYATLLQLSGAFANVTTASESATQSLQKQREDAYSALERAVSAQKRVLQSQIQTAQEVASTLDGIFGVLHDNVRELYGEVDSTRAMLAGQGNAFIDQALATAKASGYLPDADKLAEAIAAARGGLDTVGSSAERDYAALVLAGKLSGLEDVAGKQLTDAQRTVRELEGQTDQLDKTLDYWQQQIDLSNGTVEAVMSVEQAVQNLASTMNVASGSTKPFATSGGGGGPASANNIPTVNYGADEALGSFDKFKAWYESLRQNADPSKLMGEGYQVPDWLRVTGIAADGTDKELFDQYLFMKNNPTYARDFQQIMTTGRTSMSTDGSGLIKSDLSQMPPEVAEYFRKNTGALLSYEGFGLDPVLAYKLYKSGPEQFGISASNTNFTQWLRTHKWTENGIVQNDNPLDISRGDFSGGYQRVRWDPASGTLVDLDGKRYSPDGKLLGTVSRSEMEALYGADWVANSGYTYGDQSRSALYQQNIGAGQSEAEYYAALRSAMEKALSEGQSAQWIADTIASTGTLADMAAAYGITAAQLEENLRKGGANIPAFAVGTNYVPRDMLAQIHEGEAIVPKAYNPAANPGMGGGSDELLAEVRALRAEVAALRAAGEQTADNTGRSAGVLTAVQRGNSLSQVAEPTF